MAIDVKRYYESQVSKYKEDKVPKNKVIAHVFKALAKNAQRQIDHYINQIIYHPEKKSLYIHLINKVIIYEFSQARGEIKNEQI